jgi:Flp pilus assembly protein TadD
VPHLAIAVNANPNDLETRRNHALALQQSGQGAAALSAWRSLLQLTPEQPDLLNNLAWLLATDRDAAVRNGSEAVTLAQRACELTRRQQPALLGTLAAAHAEAGQFDEAISVAENAIALAQSNNQPAIAQRNRELLELYRARKPYYAP